MSIQNARQLEVTHKKLAQLEDIATKIRNNQSQEAHLKELTLRSVKQLINQLKEEIARCKVDTGSHAEEASPASSRGI
jgi:hypothetical protein